VSVLSLLTFFAYDVGLLIVAWRLALLLVPGAASRPAMVALLALALKLYVGSVLSLAVLFAGAPARTSFILLSAVVTLAAATLVVKGRTQDAPAFGRWTPAEVALAAAIAFGAAVCMATATHPLREYDSLHNFNWMLRWVVEGRSPYEFAFNYVSFWEAAFIPALVVGDSRHAFGWLSAQPLALYAIALYSLARSAGLQRVLSLSVVAAALSLPWHWGWLAGVSTLKNDTLANAGFLIATLASVEMVRARAAGWRDGVLLGLGLTFMATKFGGTVLAIPFVAVALVMPVLTRMRGSAAAMIATALVVAFVGVGHFYARNALAFGNPLYPFALSLGPIALPGPMVEQGTSILENLRDERALRLLIGVDALGRPSLVTIRLGVLACIAVLALALLRITRRLDSLVTMAGFATWGCFVWMVSTWSAGIGPGSLVYLEELRSLRYATGPVAAALVVLAAAALRIPGVRAAWFAGLLAISSIVQAALVVRDSTPVVAGLGIAAAVFAALIFMTIIAAAFALAARRLSLRGGALLVAIGAGAASLLAGEALSRRQVDPYAPMREAAAAINPSRILVYRPRNKSEASFFTGLGYHMVDHPAHESLARIVVHDESGDVPAGRYGDLLVMHSAGPGDARFAAYHSAFDRRASGTGWQRAHVSAHGTIYRWTHERQ
jgi:hypothetical protein